SGLILLVGDFPTITIELPLAWPPSGRINLGYNTMDAVWGEEAVVDALLQAVCVDGVTEVFVGITVVVAKRRGGHAELIRRLEVLKDLAPVALIARAPSVTFINDDKVEEVWRKALVEPRASFVLRDRLIDREVELAALT